MLTIKDIDWIAEEIRLKNQAELYYVAHMIEPREGLLDEHIYKSHARFKVIKVIVTSIRNAYFYYLDYVNNKDNYHVETETCYYDPEYEHQFLYMVPNGDTADETWSRIPSIIYGYRRQIIDTAHTKIVETSDPTPIKPIFTNNLTYGDLYGEELREMVESGALEWKYKLLEEPEDVDGIMYSNVTSDWYVIDIKNFPRTEMALVNTKQNCAYFRDLNEAFNYIEQLEA